MPGMEQVLYTPRLIESFQLSVHKVGLITLIGRMVRQKLRYVKKQGDTVGRV